MNTQEMHTWLKSQDDTIKMKYAINWHRLPHTLFNVSCKYFDSDDIQDIDWDQIQKSRDLGNWSHGGKVHCMGI